MTCHSKRLRQKKREGNPVAERGSEACLADDKVSQCGSEVLR